MAAMGIPVGAGTEHPRAATTPFVSLYWWSRAQTGGGTATYPERERMERRKRLRRGFTGRQRVVLGRRGQEGSLAVGKLADLAVLSAEYFSVP